MSRQCQQIPSDPALAVDSLPCEATNDPKPKLRIVANVAAPKRIEPNGFMAAPLVVADVHAPLFNLLGQRAIFFGATDRQAMIDPQGTIGRIVHLMFGSHRPSQLADPKLEALRCLVLALRGRQQGLARATTNAETAGVTRAQIESLRLRGFRHKSSKGRGRG